MNGVEGLKVSVFFGERDTADGRFLAEHVVAELDRAGLRGAILMRGVEGFGVEHRRRTDRLLTLSEDLPVVAAGTGEQAEVRAAAERISRLPFDGLVTIERIRFAAPGEWRAAAGGQVKLSVLLGRGRRVGGRPAHEQLVARLRDAGVGGASVLLGVDGILGGTRRRAGFFSGNVDVPAEVVAIGDGGRIAPALDDLAELPGGALVTLERVHVCKRDGGPVDPPPSIPERDERGAALWQKLTLYSSEQAHFGGRPVHVEAVRRLRAAGADGATALRGIWGFDGRHPPDGDSFRSLRRRVPTVTMTIDAPQRARRWLAILDAITPERGLITSEVVPARHARGAGDGAGDGGLDLAVPPEHR